MVGGEFNIRIGREGSLIGARTKQGEREKRASKDLVTNNGGAGLVHLPLYLPPLTTPQIYVKWYILHRI